MNSSDAEKPSRSPAEGQPDEAHKKLPQKKLHRVVNNDGGASDRGNGIDARPVRIGREDAQKNLPPDPDPDDPVSP